MPKLTKSISHSIYRPSGSTRVSRKRIYRVPKMNGGGFFESIFGGAETPNSAATDSMNMSTTSGSAETPTIPDNVNMTGSVKTPIEVMSESVEPPTATPDNVNITESPLGSVEPSIAPPDDMNMSESPSGSVAPLSDMSTSTNTISPIDNSLPEVDTKNTSTSSSIMDTISGAYNAAKDSLTNEVGNAASPSAAESSPMDASSPMDNVSTDEDDFAVDEPQSPQPVIGDLIKLLSDKDNQISNLLDQLESANKNFADANNKLVECLTSKISSENTLVQSSPLVSAITSPGSEMSFPGSEMSSPESAMSEGNPIESDRESPFGQSSTESMGDESNKGVFESRMGGKTRNRVKKQRRTRRKQMRG